MRITVTLCVLEGENGKRYVGITNNPERRLREHRSHMSKGGQIIGSFKLLHKETFDDYISARQREKFLKSGQGRKWLNTAFSRTLPARGG